MVSVYPLLLFGGGNISVDLKKGNFVLSVDEGWIRFQAASHQVCMSYKWNGITSQMFACSS